MDSLHVHGPEIAVIDLIDAYLDVVAHNESEALKPHVGQHWTLGGRRKGQRKRNILPLGR